MQAAREVTHHLRTSMNARRWKQRPADSRQSGQRRAQRGRKTAANSGDSATTACERQGKTHTAVSRGPKRADEPMQHRTIAPLPCTLAKRTARRLPSLLSRFQADPNHVKQVILPFVYLLGINTVCVVGFLQGRFRGAERFELLCSAAAAASPLCPLPHTHPNASAKCVYRSHQCGGRWG
jgi:hypothetical protein